MSRYYLITSKSSTVAPVLQKRLEGLMIYVYGGDVVKENRRDQSRNKAIVEADSSQITSELAAVWEPN